MNKKTTSFLGFVFGFCLVSISCGTNGLSFFSRASILGGCILGSLFGILGFLLGNKKDN